MIKLYVLLVIPFFIITQVISIYAKPTSEELYDRFIQVNGEIEGLINCYLCTCVISKNYINKSIVNDIVNFSKKRMNGVELFYGNSNHDIIITKKFVDDSNYINNTNKLGYFCRDIYKSSLPFFKEFINDRNLIDLAQKSYEFLLSRNGNYSFDYNNYDIREYTDWDGRYAQLKIEREEMKKKEEEERPIREARARELLEIESLTNKYKSRNREIYHILLTQAAIKAMGIDNPEEEIYMKYLHKKFYKIENILNKDIENVKNAFSKPYEDIKGLISGVTGLSERQNAYKAYVTIGLTGNAFIFRDWDKESWKSYKVDENEKKILAKNNISITTFKSGIYELDNDNFNCQLKLYSYDLLNNYYIIKIDGSNENCTCEFEGKCYVVDNHLICKDPDITENELKEMGSDINANVKVTYINPEFIGIEDSYPSSLSCGNRCTMNGQYKLKK